MVDAVCLCHLLFITLKNIQKTVEIQLLYRVVIKKIELRYLIEDKAKFILICSSPLFYYSKTWMTLLRVMSAVRWRHCCVSQAHSVSLHYTSLQYVELHSNRSIKMFQLGVCRNTSHIVTPSSRLCREDVPILDVGS